MVSDQVWMLAEIARLSLASVQRFILWLLADKLPQQAAMQTAEFLTGGYLAHDTPIMIETARNLGLPVSAGVPERVYELFETCAFGLCKRPCLASYSMADLIIAFSVEDMHTQVRLLNKAIRVTG